MGIYVVVSLLIILISSIYSYKIKYLPEKTVEGKRVFIITVFLIFTLLMALRGNNVGVDVAPYSRIYTAIGNSDSLTLAFTKAPLTAPVYVLICWMLFHISPNPQFLIVFEALFVNIGLFEFIRKASKDYVVSCHCWIGLTMLYASMNGNRQFMAVVLILNAYYYFSKNYFDLKAWFLFVIAIGIHTTSLFALITIAGMLISKSVNNYRKIAVVSMVISVVFAVGFTRLVPYVLRFFPNYNIYTLGGGYDILRGTGGGRIVILYAFLFLIAMLWYFQVRNKEFDILDFDSTIFFAIIFGTVFGIFNSKNQLITRMLWYYIPLFITFIPAMLSRYKGSNKRVLDIGTVSILYIYSLISLLENHNGVVPYNFFWQ